MAIVNRIFKSCKNEVRLYLAFRRLSHEQIADLVRQADLAQAAKAKATPKTEYRLSPGPWGLLMLVEL